MNIAIITGSAGLIGSEAVKFFSGRFEVIAGIDNNLRQYFFGREGSSDWNKNRLQEEFANYQHYDADIRDIGALEAIFAKYNKDIKLVLHTAAKR